MRKIALLCGLVASVGAFATPEKDDLNAVRFDCVAVGSVEACERWEQYDPVNSSEYWGQVWTGNGWTVQALADLWGVDVDVIANLDQKLLLSENVDSAVNFNPWAVDFKDADGFEKSDKLNPDQAWKWLRYRRAEIGICFEDESMDEHGQCVAD